MNFVTVEKEQDVKLLKVTVEEADYKEAVDKSLRQYKKKVNMPGFRPGMVPLSIVSKMYGKSIIAEESFRAASNAAEKYVEDNKLEILRNIIPSEDQAPLDFDSNTTFEYSFEFALEPKCNLDFSSEDEIEYVKIVPDEKEVKNYRDNFLSRYSEMVEVDTVEKTDSLVVKLDNQEVAVDDAYVGMVALDEKIQTELVGKQKGFKKDIDINDIYKNDSQKKANLHIDDEALKTLNPKFSMEIVTIKRLQAPELNEEFFKKAFPEGNVTDEASFDKYVEEQLEREFKIGTDDFFASKVQKYITEKSEVKMPKQFLKDWLYIMNQGKLSKEEVEKNADDFVKYFTWVYLKEKIASKNNIKLTKDDVREAAMEFCRINYRQYGLTNIPDDLLMGSVDNLMENSDQVSHLKDRALENKIAAFFKEQVTLKEKTVTIDEFNKIAQEINK